VSNLYDGTEIFDIYPPRQVGEIPLNFGKNGLAERHKACDFSPGLRHVSGVSTDALQKSLGIGDGIADLDRLGPLDPAHG
jgi:hypothetical protein